MHAQPANDVANDRAIGALLGLAIGDALGMPSQTLPRERIRALYGSIADFVAPAADQPVSASLPAGAITDDTEQCLLLARHLLARRGGFDETVWADELLAWERETHARGVNDLLGPSTRRAIEALQNGAPAEEAGRFGVTNGAAMRIAPVGIATPLEPLEAFLDSVAATCRLTHNTPEAIGAAAAVAAAVSAGIDGASFDDALPGALAAARAGERRGTAGRPGAIAERIERALALRSRTPARARRQPTGSPTRSASASRPPNPCPWRSRWRGSRTATPGGRRSSPPMWATTPIRSARSPPACAGPAVARRACRQTRYGQ